MVVAIGRAAQAGRIPRGVAPIADQVAILTLAAAKRVGIAGVRRLLGDSEALEHALDGLSASEFAGARSRASAVLDAASRGGIRVMIAGQDGYPVRLFGLADHPPVLFALGDTARFARPAVAVVGSRQATPYGMRVTRRLAGELASRGVTIVSGLAVGIDAEAHITALEAGGHTVAVMGTGVDVPYPRGHDALHARVAREGTVVSERPPGALAHAGAFPRRNRLIAALADVTIVVEAGIRSGALITARIAGEIGRTVGAVPGPVDLPSSEGSNALLRDGVQVITNADEVLSLLTLSPSRSASSGELTDAPWSNAGAEGVASSSERRLLDVLRAGPRMTDELVAASGLAPREVVCALASLDLLGLVQVSAGGLVART